MNPLVKITVKIFYEIHGSQMYGGPESIGYSMIRMDVRDQFFMDADEKLTETKRSMADMMGVPEEAVRMISEQEYELNTEESDETVSVCDFPELFRLLREKGLETRMMESYYRVFLRTQAALEGCCEELDYLKFIEKRKCTRSYLWDAVDFILDLGLISAEDGINLRNQLWGEA